MRQDDEKHPESVPAVAGRESVAADPECRPDLPPDHRMAILPRRGLMGFGVRCRECSPSGPNQEPDVVLLSCCPASRAEQIQYNIPSTGLQSDASKLVRLYKPPHLSPRPGDCRSSTMTLCYGTARPPSWASAGDLSVVRGAPCGPCIQASWLRRRHPRTTCRIAATTSGWWDRPAIWCWSPRPGVRFISLAGVGPHRRPRGITRPSCQGTQRRRHARDRRFRR